MKTPMSWETISTEQLVDCRVFSVNRNLASRSEGRTHDFYVLHPNNWVNVIAIDSNDQVILIEQFRHGTSQLTLEIPGGMVDPEDPSAKHAAARELLEETGYAAKDLIHIGRNHPNPAMQSNYCDTFLALNVEKLFEPKFHTTEYIEVRLTPLADIPELIASGKVTHSLVIVAFYYMQLYERTQREFVPPELAPEEAPLICTPE